MPEFQHSRHKPPTPLARPRGLVVACSAMRSSVNLSRIVRAAGCCAVERVICCGQAKVDPKIARDAAEAVKIETHRSLPPVLKTLRAEGYSIVGLEQTSGSKNLHSFDFEYKTALVIGNERHGLSDQELALLDDVVEIPVWGTPHSYNVATATAIALYEYCRQFPTG